MDFRKPVYELYSGFYFKKGKGQSKKMSSLLVLLWKKQPVLLLNSVPQGAVSQHHTQAISSLGVCEMLGVLICSALGTFSR